MKGAMARAFAEDLAPVIGAEAARKLMTALAGRMMYVPRAVGPHHPISVAIGPEKAATFCEYFFGQRIDFPVAPARRRRILDLAAGGLSIPQIATELLVSERFVYKVLAEARETDSRQHRLFG
jgi:DNA-binding NarL/FixJ family response regulator